MRLLAMFCGAIVLAQVTLWVAAFARSVQPSEHPLMTQSRRQDPWANNESRIDAARAGVRNEVMAALGRADADLCREDGRAKLVAALENYFEQRRSQLRAYPTNWGDAGSRHIAAVWSSPEDIRIERLTREVYRGGRLQLDDLRPYVRDAVLEVVKGERAAQPACHG